MKLVKLILCFLPLASYGQTKLNWKNIDTAYAPLPKTVHVYVTDQPLDASPFKAYYVIADLKEKAIDFTTDTTLNRRLTPAQFYEKNDKAVVVVNGTFFSFATNQNLNLVIKDGRLVSYNQQTISGKRKDTLTYRHPFSSAIGISKKREADIAWTITDSSERHVYASQRPVSAIKDSVAHHRLAYYVDAVDKGSQRSSIPSFKKWKMKTAIGGGPVLVQNQEIKVTNNEEMKFAGKAIHDKHPRTAIGYTKDNKLIILAVEGRNKTAAGASLLQMAQILKDLGCVEALNLDGGGSSCLLINGKETIKPSDPTGQRPVPAVFIIHEKDESPVALLSQIPD